MARVTSSKSFILLSLFLSIIFLSNQGGITLEAEAAPGLSPVGVAQPNEPKAAPAAYKKQKKKAVPAPSPVGVAQPNEPEVAPAPSPVVGAKPNEPQPGPSPSPVGVAQPNEPEAPPALSPVGVAKPNEPEVAPAPSPEVIYCFNTPEGCVEPEAAPAPSPEACDNPEGCVEPETGPQPPPPPPPCEWDESCGDPWPEVRVEEDGCDLIVEGAVCDWHVCGYFTCEDNCVHKWTREQGCVWDEWRQKLRCICR